MKENKKGLIVFCSAFIVAFIYWRLRVFLIYGGGSISFLRGFTNLQVHHSHYGTLILASSLLIYLFWKRNIIIVALIGFGLGSILDSFVSSLFESQSRVQEIANYVAGFWSTLFIFVFVIIFSVVLYLIGEAQSGGTRYKK